MEEPVHIVGARGNSRRLGPDLVSKWASPGSVETRYRSRRNCYALWVVCRRYVSCVLLFGVTHVCQLRNIGYGVPTMSD